MTTKSSIFRHIDLQYMSGVDKTNKKSQKMRKHSSQALFSPSNQEYSKY